MFERNSPRHSRSILCRIFCGALNDECLASYQNLVKHDLHRQICFWTWSLLDHFPSWPNGQLVGWKRACLCTTMTQLPPGTEGARRVTLVPANSMASCASPVQSQLSRLLLVAFHGLSSTFRSVTAQNVALRESLERCQSPPCCR